MKPLTIAGEKVNPGEKKLLEIAAASLYTQTPLKIPIHVLHGKTAGPKLFVIAAMHGDEINGVEIVRRVLNIVKVKSLRGSLIALPIANIHGFISLSRYLPDRRDLNRSFPGSKAGSLASRLAYLYTNEIVAQCTHGIDIHTGNIHSENLPHVRTNVEMPESLKLAKAFNAPVILNNRLRDGSIRQAANDLNIPVIVYEGGEALRFNEVAIRMGVRGVMQVLYHLKMLARQKQHKQRKMKTGICQYSVWARAERSGVFRQVRRLGMNVEEGEIIGYIADPFTSKETEVISPVKGIIIGRNTLPLINEGDALFHVAKFKNGEEVTTEVDELQNYFIENPFYPY